MVNKSAVGNRQALAALVDLRRAKNISEKLELSISGSCQPIMKTVEPLRIGYSKRPPIRTSGSRVF